MEELLTDQELERLRWAINVCLFGLCSAYKSHNRGICYNPINWKGNMGNSRCKFHAGKNVHGPKDKRYLVMSKLTKLDKRAKLPLEVLNETEMDYYNGVVSFIKENYEIEDDMAISQVARLYTYQTILMKHLSEGKNVDPTISSNSIRSWLNEYGLTPKSRSALDIDTSAMPVGYLATVIMEVHEKMEREQKEKENTLHPKEREVENTTTIEIIDNDQDEKN